MGTHLQLSAKPADWSESPYASFANLDKQLCDVEDGNVVGCGAPSLL